MVGRSVGWLVGWLVRRPVCILRNTRPQSVNPEMKNQPYPKKASLDGMPHDFLRLERGWSGPGRVGPAGEGAEGEVAGRARVRRAVGEGGSGQAMVGSGRGRRLSGETAGRARGAGQAGGQEGRRRQNLTRNE